MYMCMYKTTKDHFIGKSLDLTDIHRFIIYVLLIKRVHNKMHYDKFLGVGERGGGRMAIQSIIN